MGSLEELSSQLLNPHSRISIDALLDAIVALFNDCNFPVLKRIRSIEAFLLRNEQTIKQIAQSRVNSNDFKLLKIIGRGAFGEVHLVRNSKDTKVYAMKLLDKIEMIRRAESVFFWEEREIMARARENTHDWIVQLHYAFQDSRFLYMVMEFMPGGDLVNLMAIQEPSEEWAQFYTAELILALECIHEMGYIHRDVKPDNMLISSSGHIKLADFGTCIKMGPDKKVRCSTAVGTPDYISPEMLRSQGTEGVFGREVDWWAVGIFLYEMLTGETPFYADSLVNTYQRIMNHKSELTFPDDAEISDNAKDIICKFLSDQNTRLGCNGTSEIKSHPFFRNENWNFHNIQHSKPPYLPQLKGDDDTSYFDNIDDKDNKSSEFQIPKAFTGNQLPFIGFTYSNDYGPLEVLKKSLSEQNNLFSNQNHLLQNGHRDLKDEKSKANEQLTNELVKSQQLITDLTLQLSEEREKLKELKEQSTQQDDNSRKELMEYRKKVGEINQALEVERCQAKLNDAIYKKKFQTTEQLTDDLVKSQHVIADLLQQLDVERLKLSESMAQSLERDENSKKELLECQKRLGDTIQLVETERKQGAFYKEQTRLLEQKCQRETQLKQIVIEKLHSLGEAKGINVESKQKRGNNSSRRKKDEKRMNELIELKVNERVKEFKKIEEGYQNDFQFMQQQLQEEQARASDLQNELMECRQILRNLKKNPSDSDINTYLETKGGGLSSMFSVVNRNRRRFPKRQK